MTLTTSKKTEHEKAVEHAETKKLSVGETFHIGNSLYEVIGRQPYQVAFVVNNLCVTLSGYPL